MSQQLESQQNECSYSLDLTEKKVVIHFFDGSNIKLKFESLIPNCWNYMRMKEVLENPKSTNSFLLGMWSAVAVARDECIDRGLITDE